MDAFSTTFPGEWAARKTHFAELIEEMRAVGLPGMGKTEKRRPRRWLASRQNKQDAKTSKSMFAAWRCRRCQKTESPNKGIALGRHYRVVPGWTRRCR